MKSSIRREIRRRQLTYRGFFYLLGLVFLAFGITLNTKTMLGVSPIISVPNSVATIWHLPLAGVIMVYYILFVVMEFALRPKNFGLRDILQAPMSIGFSTLIGGFDAYLDFSHWNLPARLVLLMAAVVCTGIGIVLTVGMDVIPNPADGLVATISQKTGWNMGLTKNFFDGACVVVTVAVSLCFARTVIGVGLGTLVTVLFTGRVVALVNALFRAKTRMLAGLQDEIAKDAI